MIILALSSADRTAKLLFYIYLISHKRIDIYKLYGQKYLAKGYILTLAKSFLSFLESQIHETGIYSLDYLFSKNLAFLQDTIK